MVTDPAHPVPARADSIEGRLSHHSMTPSLHEANRLMTISTAASAIAKKPLPRKAALKPEYIARTEFHQELDAMHDRLSDKVDANHKELLTFIAHQGETF